MVIARRQEGCHRRNTIGALAVLDYDRLAPPLAQPFRQQSAGQISAGPWR
jgi:hypothetical protein